MIDEVRRIATIRGYDYVKAHSGASQNHSTFLQKKVCDNPSCNKFDAHIERREPFHGIYLTNFIVYDNMMELYQ